MVKWDNTTFVQRNDADEVLRTLVAQFAHEGYELDESAGSRSARKKKETALVDGMRVVAWIPGLNPEWGILKTFPSELLASPASGTVLPRLCSLAMTLRCHILSTHIYDGTHIFTVESNGHDCLIRCAPMDELDDMMTAEFEAGLDQMPASDESPPVDSLFVLWPEMNEICEEIPAFDLVDDLEEFGEKLTGRPFSVWSNEFITQRMFHAQPLPIEGSRIGYFHRK